MLELKKLLTAWAAELFLTHILPRQAIFPFVICCPTPEAGMQFFFLLYLVRTSLDLTLQSGHSLFLAVVSLGAHATRSSSFLPQPRG